MIFLNRRRLFFWLIKAYIKRWRTTIVFSFVLGLFIFFAIYLGFASFIPTLSFKQEKTIGIVGAYTTDNLPSDILHKVSKGLTSVSDDGNIKPDASSLWSIKDGGRTYIFRLRPDINFDDGSEFTSSSVSYNFLDVKIEKPDKYTIIFKLKENYSPFLITVSQPIFKKGFVGLGDYKVESINLNGDFVKSMNLTGIKNKNEKIIYQFYPTEESLKMAYVLGDVDEAQNLHDVAFKNTSLYSFKNTAIEKKIDYRHLVTLFYNTQDKVLSDKKIREGLSYAIPDSFSYGERNYGPYPKFLWTNQDGLIKNQKDYDHANLLLAQPEEATSSTNLNLTVSTLPQYESLALELKKSFEKVDVKTEIKVVNSLPSNFQIFLGDFTVPRDPDQYTLWHSDQPNNITNYKNLRIDKLLEDGRQTIDFENRQKIYFDFQKYLTDDPPASFILFPYTYTVKRN